MEYEFLQATVSDFEFCYELTKQNMYNLFCRHWGGWADSEFRKGFIAENIQIIVMNNKRIGYLSHKMDGEYIFIDNIQIASEYQGRGIGTKVLADLLARYQNYVIRLTTFIDNPAKHLYERLAFVIYEQNGSTIKMEKRPNKMLH